MGEVLPCIWAPGVGCRAAQRPLAGLRMGLALPQPGMVPAAPLCSGDPAMVHTERSCCLQEPCFLSYGRQEVFQEGGRQRWERQAGLGRGRLMLPWGAASPLPPSPGLREAGWFTNTSLRQ